jgi:hypothetical protein
MSEIKMTGDKLPLVVYLALAFTLMIPLFGQGYYLALDMSFGPNTFSDFQFEDFYGYTPNPYGAYLPLKMVLSALSQFISVEVLQKILLFLVLFLCGASAHFSLPSKCGSSRYFAGFLYTLNPFVFVRFLAGHWTFLLSYALWPISIKLFLDFLNNPEKQNALAKVALLTFLVSIYSHGVIILLLSYLLAFLFHIVKSDSRQLLLKSTTILAAVVLAMNLFWIIPTVLMFGDVYAPASAEAYLEDFGAASKDLPLPLAVLTMHGFWRDGFTYTKDVFDFWYVPFAVIVAVIVYGLLILLREKREKALFLFSLLLLGFLLSLGAESPISWIFTALNGLIPIGFVFRDSQKFVGLMALAYAMLGAYGVHYLSQKTKNRKRTALLIALIAVPVLHNYGFFGFLGQIGPTAFPQDWVEAGRIIAEDNTLTNVLVLPLHLYSWHPWVNSTQKTLGNPASGFFSKPVIVAQNIEMEHVYSDWADPEGSYLSYMFENRRYVNNTAEMLLPLNVRYILLFKHDEDSIHYLYLFQRKQGVKDIELVYEGQNLYLFRNNLVKGPFIASKENGSGDSKELMELSGKGLYSTDVQYEEITPASYQISDSPYPYVVFADDYNRFVTYDGTQAFSWHGLANGFAYAGPGKVENRLFYWTLALFLLSWLIALALLLNASTKQLLLLAALFVAIYPFASNGMLKPSALGALIILSVTLAAVLRCWKKG